MSRVTFREINLLPESIKKRISKYQIKKLLIHMYFVKYSKHSLRICNSNQTAKKRLWSNDTAWNLKYFTYQPQKEWPATNAFHVIPTTAFNVMMPVFSKKKKKGWLAIKYPGSRTVGGSKYRKNISLPFLMGIFYLQCKLLLPQWDRQISRGSFQVQW